MAPRLEKSKSGRILSGTAERDLKTGYCEPQDPDDLASLGARDLLRVNHLPTSHQFMPVLHRLDLNGIDDVSNTLLATEGRNSTRGAIPS